MSTTCEIKTAKAKRQELYETHEGCPVRSYVQLEVPAEAAHIQSVKVYVYGTDQGDGSDGQDEKRQDAENGGHVQRLNTWYEVAVERSEKSPGLCHVNPIRFHRNLNKIMKPTMHVSHWDRESASPFHVAWLSSLYAGDTIHIVPHAFGMGWTNVLLEAGIEIAYQEQAVQASLDPPQLALRSIYPTVLDCKRGQIRLLVVDAGTFQDPFTLRFEITSLFDGDGHASTDSLPYWALSYCWQQGGKSASILPVTLEDGSEGTFLFQETVAMTLKRLRRPDEPIRIWIDAVCINQKNNVERGEQVAMMNSIYQRALEVHIWLGETGVAARAALAIMRDIDNVTRRPGTEACPGGPKCACPPGWTHRLERDAFLADEHCPPLPEREGAVPVGHMNLVFQKHQGSFPAGHMAPDIQDNPYGLAPLMSELFGNPWFWRVWVVQEAVLARRATVHLGEDQMRWRDLLRIHSWLDSADYRFAFWERHYQPQVQMPATWAVLSGLEDEHEKTVAGQPANTVSRRPMLDTFLDALDINATDPRDKLYALLAFGRETQRMGSHLPPDLRPDYTKLPEQVFADFTRWWIRENDSLAILSKVHAQTARTWNRSLGDWDPRAQEGADVLPRPSWTLSPQGQRRFIYSNLHDQFAFRAGGTTTLDQALVADTADPLALKVRGYRLGCVLRMGYPPMVTAETGCRIIFMPSQHDREAEDARRFTFLDFDMILRGYPGKEVCLGVEPEIPAVPGLESSPEMDIKSPTVSVGRVFEVMMDPCRENTFERNVSRTRTELGQAGAGSWLHKDNAHQWLTKYIDHHQAHSGLRTRTYPVLWCQATQSEKGQTMDVSTTDTDMMLHCVSPCSFVGGGDDGHDDGHDASLFGGLCPWYAREDDVVVLLHGATVPFLLRPVADSSNHSSGPTYQLVGECFVDGAMDGTLMMKKLEQKEPIETFVIV